jgi:hypothetical protein
MLNLLLTGLLLAEAPAQTPPPAPASSTAPAPATPAAPALGELLTLRAENHLLQLRLAQLEAQLRTEALTRQRAELDAAIAAAHPGWRMDWDTGRLVKADAPKDATP